ncbi:MAG: NAD(P)H-dependent oxidoreductase subunit E, partial [Bacillota bacterium]
IDLGETTPDGLFTLESTSCLGICSVGPAMMVNDRVFGNLTREKVRLILRRYAKDKEASVS